MSSLLSRKTTPLPNSRPPGKQNPRNGDQGDGNEPQETGGPFVGETGVHYTIWSVSICRNLTEDWFVVVFSL